MSSWAHIVSYSLLIIYAFQILARGCSDFPDLTDADPTISSKSSQHSCTSTTATQNYITHRRFYAFPDHDHETIARRKRRRPGFISMNDRHAINATYNCPLPIEAAPMHSCYEHVRALLAISRSRTYLMRIVLGSVYARRAYSPNSRPMPDCLRPPKGTFELVSRSSEEVGTTCSTNSPACSSRRHS